jgi:hypothetical protein
MRALDVRAASERVLARLAEGDTPDCSLALAERNTGAFLRSLDCHKRLLGTSCVKHTLGPARLAGGAQRA